VQVDLKEPGLYVNRWLSLLDFQERVLSQACDVAQPLLERVKFLSICASNLDEFYSVRFAGVKRQAQTGVSTLGPDGLTPAETLRAIDKRAEPMTAAAADLWVDVLRPELGAAGITVADYADLDAEERRYLRRQFHDDIFPVLTPLAVDPGHPFPYISNMSLSLAVILRDPEADQDLFARVKVPLGMLSRFVRLPGDDERYVCLEEVVAAHLEYLFAGMEVTGVHAFRVTRNADLYLEEDATDDLLTAVEHALRRQRFGEVVRLEVAEDMPERMLELLVRELEVGEEDVFPCRGMLGLDDLGELAEIDRPDLKDDAWVPRVPHRLARIEGQAPDFFAAIRDGDILVHHPYDSFDDTVEEFIEQAACDTRVVAIKQTLYRAGAESRIVPALIRAADEGKQVACLIEVKARADEEANIAWARELERAGVHVVYGLVGLKTHCKVALVIRRDDDGLRRYFHLGTGNYNPGTARLYTDLGVFSCRDDMGADLTDLFNYLTGYSRQRAYRRILVAPVNLRDRLHQMIERETGHAETGQPAAITAKMNSLVDPEMIQALYRASRAGVRVRLNVRGICCLRPGVPGVSDNIEVVSVVDRFLEHGRIYRFENAAQPEYYIGSADLMQRNLDARVECVIPVDDISIQQRLEEILVATFTDNVASWQMRPDGSWARRHPEAGEDPVRVQERFMAMAVERSERPAVTAAGRA
jgi:polyphosphate kinase